MDVYALFVSTRGLQINAERRWEVRPIGKVQGPYIEKRGVPKQATIHEKITGQQQIANIVLFVIIQPILILSFFILWIKQRKQNALIQSELNLEDQ